MSDRLEDLLRDFGERIEAYKAHNDTSVFRTDDWNKYFLPETKQALQSYTTNKIIGELNDLSEVIFELFNNNDLEDEQIDNELLQSVIKTCIIELKALQKEES